MTVNKEKVAALPEKTVAWIKKIIREEREVFRREMRSKTSDYVFGRRFESDEVVIENLVGQCGPPSFGMSLGAAKKIEDWALRTEIDWHADHGAMMKKIWVALSQAAATDYYYEHEKDWT